MEDRNRPCCTGADDIVIIMVAFMERIGNGFLFAAEAVILTTASAPPQGLC